MFIMNIEYSSVWSRVSWLIMSRMGAKPIISQFKQHIVRGAIYIVVELMLCLFSQLTIIVCLSTAVVCLA